MGEKRIRKVTFIPPLAALPGKKSKRKVAAYARVSTAAEEQESSLIAQRTFYEKHILENPEWEFVEVYYDDGVSGLSYHRREGFNLMVADALEGKIDLILTKSLSRFARNTVDTLTTIRRLKEKNVEVFFEKENIYTFDSKGEFLITLMSSLAQEESRSISENVTWGRRKQFSDGKYSMNYSTFLGYKKGMDGLPAIDEDQAPIIRLIYLLYLEGYTIYSLKHFLDNIGIPSPQGNKWHVSVIESILTNEKYKGDALLQKSITVDFLTKKRKLNEGDLDKLMPLPKINLVATQGANDEKDLFEICGTKEYRKMLDRQFKNNDSNFKIAVVVDMWITGFDVPSLAVMYIDKPLQKHTLIQTISRVNRVFDGKDKGLVVDYIGIKNDMLEAVKKYGSAQESPVDELNITLGIFRNHLAMIDELLVGFNATKFYIGEPLERLTCLNMAAEYVQSNKEMETRFMGLSRRLKSAYTICFPSGELTDIETGKAQFYLAIRSIIYKQTKGDAPDAEIMNRVVEEMVRNAIACTGIENIVDENKSVDLFSDEFIAELDAVKMPITKFNALLKLLRKAISSYGRTNKVKAQEFDERLRSVVEAYNSRDKLVFTSEVVADFVNDLSDQLLQILKDLQEDNDELDHIFDTDGYFM